jgi:hypothetical protein
MILSMNSSFRDADEKVDVSGCRRYPFNHGLDG